MVRHILKDGTEVKDIKGHVVKIEDAQSIYTLIEQINRKGKGNGKHSSKKQNR